MLLVLHSGSRSRNPVRVSVRLDNDVGVGEPRIRQGAWFFLWEILRIGKETSKSSLKFLAKLRNFNGGNREVVHLEMKVPCSSHLELSQSPWLQGKRLQPASRRRHPCELRARRT